MEIKNSIRRHIVWKALSLFSLVVLNILFARYYAAAITGWVIYLFTVNSFIIQLFGFSLEAGVGYYMARNSIRESRLINFALTSMLIVSLITLLLYIAYSSKYSTRVEYSLMYPISFVAGNMLIAFGNAIFYSKYNFTTPNILNVPWCAPPGAHQPRVLPVPEVAAAGWLIPDLDLVADRVAVLPGDPLTPAAEVFL